MLYNTLQQEDSSNVHIGDTVFNISRDVGILIYNRVPKSGSTTVNNILSDLSKRHRFSTFMSGAYASHSMPTSKVMSFHTNTVTQCTWENKWYLFRSSNLRHMWPPSFGKERHSCTTATCTTLAQRGTLGRGAPWFQTGSTLSATQFRDLNPTTTISDQAQDGKHIKANHTRWNFVEGAIGPNLY